MSWLSSNLTGGLSNITGQISNFTREMLTEGTEEVADVSAELKVARERIQELEAIIIAQKSEYESVKGLNAELHDRVEAAEMQIQKMKHDYRSQLEQKEKELIELRELLQEKEHWQYDSGFERRAISGSVSDNDENEIHRLQKELTKLQKENSKLKKENFGDQETEKLHKQVDEYQHELATLQTSHSQKIASLTRKYKNDFQLWQKEKEDLMNTIEDLQHHRNHDHDEKISELGTSSQETDELREALEEANSEIKVLQDRMSEKEGKILELITSCQESKSLKEALEIANNRIKSLEHRISTNEENVLQSTLNSKNTESLREALEIANTEVKSLKDSVLTKEAKITELLENDQENLSFREAIEKADNQREKLQESIREKEAQIIELSTKNEDIELLREDLEKATIEIRSLKNSISSKEDKIVELKSGCEEIESIKKAFGEANYQIELLKNDLRTKEAEVIRLKTNSGETDSLRDALEEANEEIKMIQESARNKEEKIAELMENVCDVASLKEELETLKDEILQSRNLEGDIENLMQEKKVLETELKNCCLSEQEKCRTLQQLKEEIGVLGSATEELMEELEMSQNFRKEQKVEIESLKKICTIKGDVTEEIVRLRDALAALWERYVIVMVQYEKVRLELHSSNQRLLAQMQASHTNMREIRHGLNASHDKILESNTGKLEEIYLEKQALIQKSSEVRMEVEEQEGAVIDLHSDNEQVLQEIKLCVADLGGPASLEDESTDLVNALQAEKALLEKTIVGLEHKVQDLEEEVQTLKGMGPSEHEMDESIGSRDIYHTKQLAKSSGHHNKCDNVEESDVRVNDVEQCMKRQNQEILSLQDELDEYRRFAEAFEEDKEALETAVLESRKLLKQTEKQKKTVIAERNRLLKSFRVINKEFENKLNVPAEDKNFTFEDEVEKFEMFSAQLKEWMAQNEAKKSAKVTEKGGNWSTVSLDELDSDRSTDIESESFRQTIADLQLDNSELREKTEKLISDLNSKVTSVTVLQSELEKKCHELESVREERANLMAQLIENEKNMKELQESFESERLELATSRDVSITTLQAEQQDILGVLQEKQREAMSLKDDNHRLMSLLQDKQQENDDLICKTESLSSLVNESEQMLEELRNENRTILSQLDENMELNESVTSDKKSLLKENDKLKEQVKDIQNKLDCSEEETAKYSSLKAEVEDLQAKLKTAAKNEKSYEEKLNILNMAKASIQNSLESRNKELDTVKTLHSEKETEVNLLRSEQERLNDIISATNGNVKELQQRLNMSVSEKDQLSQSLHEKDVEIGQLQLDIREKGAQNDFLRLDLAKVTKSLKEKEQVLHLSSTAEKDAPENVEYKLRTLMKIIEEKDYEMEALKQKDASLLELVTESERSGTEIREHYEEQIQQLRSERERDLAELAHKDEELLTVNDRLEAMKEKMSGKDQASAMLHSEYRKLVSLNQSQGNDIAKLREKNDALVKLLDEKNKVIRHEDFNRFQEENNRLNLQIEALHSEQERLVGVIHEKDKQLKEFVQASEPKIKPLNPLQELLAERRDTITNGYGLSEMQHEDEISNLRNELSRLREFLNQKQKMVLTLTETNDSLELHNNQLIEELNILKSKSLPADSDKIALLQEKLETLNQSISDKDKDIFDMKKQFDEKRHELLHQLEVIRSESKEVEQLKDKEIFELKNKVIHLFSSVKSVDSGFKAVTCDLSTNASIELSFQALIQTFRTLWTSFVRERDYEISCLKEKVANLSILSNSNESPGNLHLENALKEKEELAGQLLKSKQEFDEILNQKELMESNLQGQLITLSKRVSEKEKELVLLSERLKAEKNDFEKLKQEKGLLTAINEENQVEVERQKAKIQQLSVTENEHRENISKLNKLIEEYNHVVDEREKKIDQLLEVKDQNDTLVQRVTSLEKELSIACNDKKGAENKLKSELDRLRDHLIMVEESYTHEALLAEERERDLAERLERAEKQLISSSSSLKDTNRQATQQRESLQEQLHVIAGQRDEAILQLATAQEQTQQYSVALQNLQMVLEQFQREKEDQLSVAKEQAQKEIDKAKSETLQMQQREADLRNQLTGAARVLQDVGALKQQIADKDEEIAKWKVEVTKMEQEVLLGQQKIKDLRTNNDSKVDKVLVKNLLLGYFHTPEAKRSDAAHVLGGLLDFTPEEFAQVGSGATTRGGAGGGWISSLLPFGATSRTPTQKQPAVGTPTKSSSAEQSFSELFVSFLQHESENITPGTPARGSDTGKNVNPLLHGISPQQASLNQGKTASAMPKDLGVPLRQFQPSVPGDRPRQSNLAYMQPDPSAASSTPTSNILVNNPSTFTPTQNSRSSAMPLLVRPGQDLSSHDTTVSPLRTIIGKS